ncbi:putative leucine-rich repeat domain, L domain-containing protein [Rosa chinensis]|uniref:Putative leucine-rich repeat domain, L domain-containing protein n=1 Tax=Rosa chinensis TaxID=74649 RepID=A0A2P6R3X4_ROSCH|nr:putative leucine-rich repeat domain, L domain-containing protein [Rosa chinensis]
MRVPDIRAEVDIEHDHPLLPSLKTMSFTAVTFHGFSFFPVLWESSSIEYLSLTACSFENHDPMCYVKSSSLKCLEVKYCHGLKFIIVHEAMNLESLTFGSPPPPYSKCTRVTVNNIPNLRKIDICVDELDRGIIFIAMPSCTKGHHQYPKSQSIQILWFIGSPSFC